MVNRGVETDASTSQKVKWRFDREAGEWVCDAQPAPLVVPPAPSAVPVAWSTSPNGPGLAYVAPAVFNVQVAAPVVALAKPKRTPRDLLHPDVLLPVVAAVIVLILFLAWAA